MVRVLGIDPGTKSFDLCGLENGKVFYEEVIDTVDIASEPEILIDAIERSMPLDLIAGPSGYGVELTFIRDIEEELLEDWYLTYILLLKRKDLEDALKQGDIGIMVYHAMTKTALQMKERNWPVCYIPGVINLPTVPLHRKINKMDMGTADKMCIAVLGVIDQARRLKLDYKETSFILVEMGFGYNAAIAVGEGRIVDGIGRTTNGIGFLTAGSLDLELVQLVGSWSKSDVFTGGVTAISGKNTPEEFFDNLNGEKSRIAWECMLESVLKNVFSLKASVGQVREILFSGRLTRIKKVKDELTDKLSSIASVRRINGLMGAEKVKEAAQGYAVVADGIAGGKYKELIQWMKIREAKGSAMDYIFHPKGIEVIGKLKKSVPFRKSK